MAGRSRRAAQLQYEAARVGGILLIIGVLHGLNILMMPVLGRLFSLNRRLQPPTAKPHLRSAPDVDIDPAHRLS